VDLVTEKEETPCCRRKGKGQQVLSGAKEEDEIGRKNGCQGSQQRCSLKKRSWILLDLDDHVQSTPKVGHFIFEQAASERKDAMNDLNELLDHWVIESLGIKVVGKLGEERQRWAGTIKVGSSVNATFDIVERSHNNRQDEEGKRNCGGCGDGDKARNVDTREHADGQKVGKYGEGVVKGHLLKAQGCDEEDASPQIPAREQAGHTGHNQAQHNRVVLEVDVINEDSSWLHQNGDEGDSGGPGRDTIQPAEAARKDDDGRDVDEVLRHQDRGPHEDLKVRVMQATRREQGEPRRVDERADLAAKPAVVRGQGRIVKPPPLQVVEIPLRDGKLCRDLHPMALGFVVAEHGRFLETWS